MFAQREHGGGNLFVFKWPTSSLLFANVGGDASGLLLPVELFRLKAQKIFCIAHS